MDKLVQYCDLVYNSYTTGVSDCDKKYVNNVKVFKFFNITNLYRIIFFQIHHIYETEN